MAINYEPKIIGFVCNWCSYADSDMAVTSPASYPPNIRIIRIPCSGWVDPLLIAKCFWQGADGVLVSGCHPGDCRYNEGNYHTRRRFALLHRLLDYLGIARGRLRLEWVSASEGQKFTQIVSDFTRELAELGPRSEG